MNKTANKILATLLIATVSALEAEAKKEGGATIEGTISGASAVTAIVVDPSGNMRDDTLKIGPDGRFRSHLPIVVPTELLFTTADPRGEGIFKFYIKSGDKVKLNIELHSSSIANTNTIKKVTCEGSEKDVFDYITNHDYYSMVEKYDTAKMRELGFAKYKQELRKDLDALEGELEKVKDKVYKASKMAEYEKRFPIDVMRYTEVEEEEDKAYSRWIDSLDRNDASNQEIANEYVKRYHNLAQRQDKEDSETDFIRSLPRMFWNKDVYYAVADQHITTVMSQAPVNIDELYSAYKKLYAGHEQDIPFYVQHTYKESKEQIAGKTAPDFWMEDTKGDSIRFSSLKGKKIYMDIWASWCGPCLAEVPSMRVLAEHYADSEDVMIISLSIDEDGEAWKEKLEKLQPTWKQYHTKGGMAGGFCKRYAIMGIPRFMLFDKRGRIITLDAPRASDPRATDMIDNSEAPLRD